MSKIAIILLFVLQSASCGQSSRQPELSELKTVAYKNGLWSQSEVKVCWLFESAATATFRAKLKEVADSAFAPALIHFSGWNLCPRNVNDGAVHLFLYDDDGSKDDPNFQKIVKHLIYENGGNNGAGHPRLRWNPLPRDDIWSVHVVLNQSSRDAFQEYSRVATELTDDGKSNFAISSSLHELGHVLGLRHEDAHPEESCGFYTEDLRDDSFIVSSYNPFSFMSRCYYRTYNYNMGILVPNKQDILGINLLYKDLVKKNKI